MTLINISIFQNVLGQFFVISIDEQRIFACVRKRTSKSIGGLPNPVCIQTINLQTCNKNGKLRYSRDDDIRQKN
jgi:hypothetical protein